MEGGYKWQVASRCNCWGALGSAKLYPAAAWRPAAPLTLSFGMVEF